MHSCVDGRKNESLNSILASALTMQKAASRRAAGIEPATGCMPSGLQVQCLCCTRDSRELAPPTCLVSLCTLSCQVRTSVQPLQRTRVAKYCKQCKEYHVPILLITLAHRPYYDRDRAQSVHDQLGCTGRRWRGSLNSAGSS